MKKILLFLALINLVQFGQSVTYLQDSFPTDGSLNGSDPIIGGNWTRYSGTLNQMQVIDGRVRLANGFFETGTEDLESSFSGGWGGGGALYAGFTINVAAAPTPGSQDYFAAFTEGGNLVGRIFIQRILLGQADGSFRLGINNQSSPASIGWQTDLPLNQNIRVVMRLAEFGVVDNVRLWVNPVNSADTSITTADQAFVGGVTGFALRQGTSLEAHFTMDDLVVGTTFAVAQGAILSIENTGNPSASYLNQGATNRPIYGFQLTANNTEDINFTGVNIARALSKGAGVGSVNNYRLYYDNDNNGYDAGDNLLATVPADSATLNFTDIADQTIDMVTPRRYVVIANVASNAVDNGTISLRVLNNSNFITTAQSIVTVAPYPMNSAVIHTFQDITAPTLTLFNPADNANNVSPNANLIAHFNENIVAGAGNITIVQSGASNFAVIPISNPQITILGNTLTINPNNNLSSNIAFHVLIPSGVIRDWGSNTFAGIINDTTWNFVTSAINTTPTIEEDDDTNSITSLIVTPTNGVAFVGKTLQMTATGVTTNGGITNVTLASTWSSGATNIATVDEAGVVTGVTPGDVFITSVFNSFTQSVKVKVRKELLITFSKVKPAKLTTRLKAGKGFAVKGKFTLATTNTLTKADIISKPLKIQVAFLTAATNTNGAMTTLQEVQKIKGFKARPKNFGKFVANPVGNTLPVGNANVLLQATLGPEGINQEISKLFTNPAPFQVRKVD